MVNSSCDKIRVYWITGMLLTDWMQIQTLEDSRKGTAKAKMQRHGLSGPSPPSSARPAGKSCDRVHRKKGGVLLLPWCLLPRVWGSPYWGHRAVLIASRSMVEMAVLPDPSFDLVRCCNILTRNFCFKGCGTIEEGSVENNQTKHSGPTSVKQKTEHVPAPCSPAKYLTFLFLFLLLTLVWCSLWLWYFYLSSFCLKCEHKEDSNSSQQSSLWKCFCIWSQIRFVLQ